MTCPSCKGEFSMDEQNTHAVCPWCGALSGRTHSGPSILLTPEKTEVRCSCGWGWCWEAPHGGERMAVAAWSDHERTSTAPARDLS